MSFSWFFTHQSPCRPHARLTHIWRLNPHHHFIWEDKKLCGKTIRGQVYVTLWVSGWKELAVGDSVMRLVRGTGRTLNAVLVPFLPIPSPANQQEGHENTGELIC